MISFVCSADLPWKDRIKLAVVRGCTQSSIRPLAYQALAVTLVLLMTGTVLAAPRTPAHPDRSPTKVIESFFASLPGYQKGDLITQSQIEKVITKLAATGTKIPSASAVAKRGLADDSFLVRELSTTEGRRFMRKMAQRPGMYSYLDRLSTIPRGQSLVHDLVRKHDGDKLVEYLATTKGGRNMGNMMASPKGGADLNAPTGRIYTADDLIAAIKSVPASP